MTFYKEKIQKELNKTLQNFKNSCNRSIKSHQIRKERKIKRLFRPRNSYKQDDSQSFPQTESHMLNFYNIITINERSLKDKNYHESYLQSNFFFKNIRKIQIKQKYLVLFLKESGLSLPSINESIKKYQLDGDPQINKIGSMLDQLSQKLVLENIGQDSDISLTAQAYQLLDNLQSNPFICKIFSEKVVISKSLLELLGYDPEQFVLESMKYKFSVLEVLSCENYPKIVQTQINFYSSLIDILHGSTSFSSLLNETSASFIDKITTKQNTQLSCQMNLSMPIPLVELLKVEKILSSSQNQCHFHTGLINEKLKKYKQNIIVKENKILQHLMTLPSNYLPQNNRITASYQELKQIASVNTKLEEDYKESDKSLSIQNSGTVQYPFNRYEYENPYFYLTF